MTYPVILRRIFPISIGRKPGFLSREMSRHTTNDSMERVDTFSVQIFFDNAFLRSKFVSPKLFE